MEGDCAAAELARDLVDGILDGVVDGVLRFAGGLAVGDGDDEDGFGVLAGTELGDDDSFRVKLEAGMKNVTNSR